MIHNVITQQECQQLIQRAEDSGFQPALFRPALFNEVLADEIRKSDRCIIDDTEFVSMLFDRIQTKLKHHDDQYDDDHKSPSLLLPRILRYKEQQQHQQHFATTMSKNLVTTGLNERLRILRYGRGCYFLPHKDGRYVRFESIADESSRLSLLLYLNDGYDGGRTRFLDPTGSIYSSSNSNSTSSLSSPIPTVFDP
jgi:hypothetical protein